MSIKTQMAPKWSVGLSLPFDMMDHLGCGLVATSKQADSPTAVEHRTVINSI